MKTSSKNVVSVKTLQNTLFLQELTVSAVSTSVAVVNVCGYDTAATESSNALMVATRTTGPGAPLVALQPAAVSASL